jgi:hypothetical protein
MNRQVKYDLTPPPGTVGVDPLAPAPPADGGLYTNAPGASNKQLNYLRSLARERVLTNVARDEILRRVEAQAKLNDAEGDSAAPGERDGVTKKRATTLIDRLLQQRKKPRDAQAEVLGPNVPGPDKLPSGHYAIKKPCSCPGGARPDTGVHVPSCDGGQIRFYHVWRMPSNPAFVKLYIAHGDSDSEIPLKSARPILDAIAADPMAAAELYGDQIGSCSQCERRLTNRVSRLLRIGPVCGGHLCDPDIWKERVARAKQALRDAGLDPSADVEDTDDLARIRELARL